MQRGLHYAIVDEVDSILIDEARTPLIISGQAEDRTELYQRINQLVAAAHAAEGGEEARAAGDFCVDEKSTPGASCPKPGHEHAEQILRARRACCREGASLYDAAQHHA